MHIVKISLSSAGSEPRLEIKTSYGIIGLEFQIDPNLENSVKRFEPKIH